MTQHIFLYVMYLDFIAIDFLFFPPQVCNMFCEWNVLPNNVSPTSVRITPPMLACVSWNNW